MVKKDLSHVWNGARCTCIERKEGRCNPKGSHIIKARGNTCFMFNTPEEAREFIGVKEVHNEKEN